MRLSISAVLLAGAAALGAQPRPNILGISHVALLVSDVEKSRAYYKDFLGYAEPFDLKNPDGSLNLTFIKINDDQFLELFTGLKPNQDRLHQIAFIVENAEALRAYLAARGVKVPDRVPKGRIGNSNFSIQDPDGHTVEFVQYEPDGWTRREKGKFLPDARGTVNHLSLEVADIERAREKLEARPYRKGYTRPIEVRTGINRKRQMNLYDPDGTRTELMERSTVDGQPAPSSLALPPSLRRD